MRARGLSQSRWAAFALLLWTVLFIAVLRSSPQQNSAVARVAGVGGDKADSEIVRNRVDAGPIADAATEIAAQESLGQLGPGNMLPRLEEARSGARELPAVVDQRSSTPGAAAATAAHVAAPPPADDAKAVNALQLELKSIRTKLSILQQLSQAHGESNMQNTTLPASEREELRRELERGVGDLRQYVSARLKDIDVASKSGNADGVAWIIRAFARGFNRRQRAILKDLDLLSVADGVGERKRLEHQQLSDIVQSRIHYLQNPPDCSRARKLVCNLNKNCGFGCQLHHAAYCFIVAYGTGRTLMLLSSNWSYAPTGGWQHAFEPLSSTCPEDPSLALAPVWTVEEATRDLPTVFLPIIDRLSVTPAYNPQSIPKDLASRLLNLHGHPFVWFVGQFVRYLFRPQKSIAAWLQKMKKDIGFENPIVGVHVRRTDKIGSEAALYQVDEYMEAVEDFYERLEERQPVPVRRVYLATDEPSVIEEAQSKYRNYTFIGDPLRAASAGKWWASRTGDDALFGIMVDIHFLSLSDYLVCTFSSQVGRLAYELMNAMHPDASRSYYSLDQSYYFGGQKIPEQIAVAASIPERDVEIELKKGDTIVYQENFRNGFISGTNKRTQKKGVYPTYKVKDIPAIVEFPSYPGVNATRHKWWFETSS